MHPIHTNRMPVILYLSLPAPSAARLDVISSLLIFLIRLHSYTINDAKIRILRPFNNNLFTEFSVQYY